MMDLKEKVAMITGAGEGIGRATALKLSRHGATVVVGDVNPATIEETVSFIKNEGGDAFGITFDVTDFEQVKEAVRKTLDVYGRIDILVNNAGWDKIEPFMDNTPDVWDKLININYRGLLFCSRAILDHMTEQKRGKIINISSDAGRVGSMGETAYAGTKGAIIAFTKSLAREMVRYNINVNCVAPGPTDTAFFKKVPEKIQEGLIKAIPMRRLAQPADIANAVYFFASDMSDYITGQVLSVNGGLTMV
jgi:2-hydroxycyclohexanecarboxyl-CoA dehydrogenase